MRSWSIHLGNFWGTELRLQWPTYVLLLIFIVAPLADGKSAPLAGRAMALFAVIVMAGVFHELAHILVAHRLGYTIRLAMLLPIGGVHLNDPVERQTPSLREESKIALAGPLFSLLLALACYIALRVLHPDTQLFARPLISIADPYRSAVWVNLFLCGLNLVPAYPLDGGRILRAHFARESGDRAMATRRAVIMGQVFSTILIFAGIVNTWLMLVGLFLFFAVQIEDRTLTFHAVMGSVALEDVMLTDFATLSPADTLEDALSKAVHSLQDDFPVIRSGDLVGIISRQRIIEALRREGNGYVQASMSKAFEVAHKKESLSVAFRKITRRGATLIPVVDEDRLVGIVTLQNLMRSMGLLAESRRLRDDAE